MDKETVVVFLDFANINRTASEKRVRLDYQDVLEYLGENRFLVEAYAYVPINPRNPHRLDGVIEDLWRAGYVVQTKLGTIAGGTYKCNFDVEIAMDVLRVVQQVKPTIIVLATGDADFVPLIQGIRKAGIRVEVAAFAETAGAALQLKCSGFIDLAVYYASSLGTKQEEADDALEERYAQLIAAQNPAVLNNSVKPKKRITAPLPEVIPAKELVVALVSNETEEEQAALDRNEAEEELEALVNEEVETVPDPEADLDI
jgi:uncharacterized LabA/DUF88 family protein